MITAESYVITMSILAFSTWIISYPLSEMGLWGCGNVARAGQHGGDNGSCLRSLRHQTQQGRVGRSPYCTPAS